MVFTRRHRVLYLLHMRLINDALYQEGSMRLINNMRLIEGAPFFAANVLKSLESKFLGSQPGSIPIVHTRICHEDPSELGGRGDYSALAN